MYTKKQNILKTSIIVSVSFILGITSTVLAAVVYDVNIQNRANKIFDVVKSNASSMNAADAVSYYNLVRMNISSLTQVLLVLDSKIATEIGTIPGIDDSNIISQITGTGNTATGNTVANNTGNGNTTTGNNATGGTTGGTATDTKWDLIDSGNKICTTVGGGTYGGGKLAQGYKCTIGDTVSTQTNCTEGDVQSHAPQSYSNYRCIANTTDTCSTEYVPVCGMVSVQCVTAPCQRTKQTFSNRCMALSKNATEITTGVCETATTSSLSCLTRPTYLTTSNAIFVEGTPSTLATQTWQNTSSSSACYYSCKSGYSGAQCTQTVQVCQEGFLKFPNNPNYCYDTRNCSSWSGYSCMNTSGTPTCPTGYHIVTGKNYCAENQSGGGYTCNTKPTYLNTTNAMFVEGTPSTLATQTWQNTNPSGACYYSCKTGYSGTQCTSVSTPIFNFTTAEYSVATGATIKLNWYQMSNVESCIASGDWSGNKPIAGAGNGGSENIVIDKEKTFTLTCANAMGQTTAKTINIKIKSTAVDPLTPAINLKVNNSLGPINAEVGQPLLGTYTSNVDVSNCTAGPGFSQYQPDTTITATSLKGGTINNALARRTFSPGTSPQEFDYTISCRGPDGGGLIWSNTVRVNVCMAGFQNIGGICTAKQPVIPTCTAPQILNTTTNTCVTPVTNPITLSTNSTTVNKGETVNFSYAVSGNPTSCKVWYSTISATLGNEVTFSTSNGISNTMTAESARSGNFSIIFDKDAGGNNVVFQNNQSQVIMSCYGTYDGIYQEFKKTLVLNITNKLAAPTYINLINANGITACDKQIFDKFGTQKYTCSIGGGCSLNGQPKSSTNPSANPSQVGACILKSEWDNASLAETKWDLIDSGNKICTTVGGGTYGGGKLAQGYKCTIGDTVSTQTNCTEGDVQSHAPQSYSNYRCVSTY